MASKSEASKPNDAVDQASLLEEWRAEVGDEEIARIVRAARDDAAAGALSAFADKEALLAYWNGRRHTSA
jgi:hypothetical protein